jgi:hypothetical protein
MQAGMGWAKAHFLNQGIAVRNPLIRNVFTSRLSFPEVM